LYTFISLIDILLIHTILSISSFIDHIIGRNAPSRIADTSMGSLGGRLRPTAHIPDRDRCEIEKPASRRVILDSERSILNFRSIDLWFL